MRELDQAIATFESLLWQAGEYPSAGGTGLSQLYAGRPDADEPGPGEQERQPERGRRVAYNLDLPLAAPPQDLASAVERTTSGFYLRAGGAGGHADEPSAISAARALPLVERAVVVHMHLDPRSERLAVAGRLLAADEVNNEVIPLLGLADWHLLVLAGSEPADQRPLALLSMGERLAELASRPVLVELRQPGVVPSPMSGRLYLPGLAEPVELGSYLDLDKEGETEPESEPGSEVGRAEQPSAAEQSPLSAAPQTDTPKRSRGPGLRWPPPAARLGVVPAVRRPWGRLAGEVAVPAFSDGSLGLPVLPVGGTLPAEGAQGWAYRAPAWVVAAELALVTAGRPFVFRPVRVGGALANTSAQVENLARVNALVTALTGGDPGLAAELAIDPDEARNLLARANQAAEGVMAAGQVAAIDELAAATGQAERERVLAAVAGAANLAFRRALQAGQSRDEAEEVREEVQAQLDEAAEDAAEIAWDRRRGELAAAEDLAVRATTAEAGWAYRRELAGDLAARLRRPLAEQTVTQDRDRVMGAGQATAGLYAAVTELPPGWVADIQFAGGLWFRPATVSADSRAWVNSAYPVPASGGLVVVGAPGHQVPAELVQAVREALEAVPPAELEALLGVVIGGLAGPVLAGLVTEQVAPVPDALADAASMPRRFSPGMLSPELAGTGTGELTAGEVLHAGRVLAGLPEEQAARRLAELPGPERGTAESWVLQVTTVAPQVGQAGRYLDGEPVGLTATQLRSMIAVLAPGVAGQTALDLLAAAADDELSEIFADGPGMLALLDAAFPPGQHRRGQLDDFLVVRFEGGRDAVAGGEVVPRGQPARDFTLSLVSPELAVLDPVMLGLGTVSELTPDQLDLLGGVLGPVADEEVLAGLRDLPPVQMARARRWLRGVRQALADVAEGQRYLSGDRLGRGPDGRLPDLIVRLAGGHARWLALELLRAASDAELDIVFADSPGMVRLLETAMPAGPPLGADLEAFALDRAGRYWQQDSSGLAGRWADRARRYLSGALGDDLTAEQQRTLARILLRGSPGHTDAELARILLTAADDDRPAAAFSPALLDPSLEGIAVTSELDDDQVQRVAGVIAGRPDAVLRQALADLPPVQRARGEWFIGVVRARAGWAREVSRYLSGDPGAEITVSPAA